MFENIDGRQMDALTVGFRKFKVPNKASFVSTDRQTDRWTPESYP